MWEHTLYGDMWNGHEGMEEKGIQLETTHIVARCKKSVVVGVVGNRKSLDRRSMQERQLRNTPTIGCGSFKLHAAIAKYFPFINM